MPRLSIVIPFLGNVERLEQSLVSVLENRPEDCEIVVVRSEVYDDPYELASEIHFLEAPGASLVTSMNLGIQASQAPVVHLLACGVEVVQGWADAALGHFDDSRVAAVAPLVLDADCPGRVVAAGITYRRGGAVQIVGRGASPETISRHRTVLAPDPSAAFYRKSAVETVGGLAAELGDPSAIVDLSLTLARAGLATVLEPASRVMAGPAARGSSGAFRQALDAERLFWRWAPALGWLGSLGLHGIVVAAECCRDLPRPIAATRLAGRLVGCFSSRPGRRPRDGLGRIAAGFRPASPAVRQEATAWGPAVCFSPWRPPASAGSTGGSNGPSAPRRPPG